MKNEDDQNQPNLANNQAPIRHNQEQKSTPGHNQIEEKQTEYEPQEPGALVDELGIFDIYEPMADLDGKIFCTAGRDAPVAEFVDDFLIMHPPQLPLYETGPEEEIVVLVDDRGIVLDELGMAKRIPTAKYKSFPIFYFGEQKEGTLKHYAVVMAEDQSLYFIFDEHGERLTTDAVYRLRNKSVNGEISKFPGLHCDLDEAGTEDLRTDDSAMVNTDFSPE